MTEDENDLIINDNGPIFIDPKDYPSKHMVEIGKCGTYGHKQIIKEMFTEELKGKGKGLLIRKPEHVHIKYEKKEE